MCGISGYFSRKTECNLENELKDSLKKQAYRGPDDEGVWWNSRVGLAHARLSIIDLSPNAHQPMTNDEVGLRLVFNGEIYNYREIRAELELLGVCFNSDSDTEVLLNAYQKWGKDAFVRFNGMFSIAIYDEIKSELVLARDRFGIKPLYYYLDDDHCFFASELGSILSFPIQRKLDSSALKAYFQFSYIPENKSIISGVSQLEQGSFLTIKEKSFKKEKYYSIPNSLIDISYQEALKEVKEKIEKSVERRLIADVPVASFLSSGLDSSILTQVASKLNPGILAFSAGFSENKYFDEAQMAKEWGDHLDIKHHIVDLKEIELVDSVRELLNSFSEPFADSSSIAYYLLSKHVSKEVKVVLSGDGADELFGGYRKHKAEWIFRKYAFMKGVFSKTSALLGGSSGDRNSTIGNVKRQMTKWQKASNLTNEERYLFWASMANEKDASNLLLHKENFKETLKYNLNDLNDVLKEDFNRVLPGDMLYKVDRTSMLNGLEVRVPFLDHDLVDFVFSLPSEWKLKGGRRKAILRDAFKNDIPSSLKNRKKRGFEVPLQHWLNSSLKNLVDELLNEKSINEQEVLNYSAVRNCIEKSRSVNPGDSTYQVWSLLVFQTWMNKYKPNI